MAISGFKQITKNIWRMLEVYLFFVVSVMGGVCLGKIVQSGKNKFKTKTEIHQVDFSMLHEKTLKIVTYPKFFSVDSPAKKAFILSNEATDSFSAYWRSTFTATHELFSLQKHFALYPKPVGITFYQQNFPLLI